MYMQCINSLLSAEDRATESVKRERAACRLGRGVNTKFQPRKIYEVLALLASRSRLALVSILTYSLSVSESFRTAR